MNIYITKVWVDDNAVYASTDCGMTASYEFSMWPRLAKATAAQRQDFYLSYSSIHWPQIDEDLSFNGMFSHSGIGNNNFIYEEETAGIVAEDDGPEYK